ncbi:MAG: hypothetical protein JW788_03555, partial [Candidatus Omnitrophica bacterium]|nr:hypothetical protein [Candidatus Omnitrophota bacterium]
MFDLGVLLNFLQFLSIIALAVLGVMLKLKMDKIALLEKALVKLRRSLEEMDEQAKLIVRTDMELNKIQEELDKKISGLYALQRLSKTISTTLEAPQVFKKITAAYVEELGFEKACAFLWDDADNRFVLHLNIGYPEEQIREILSHVNTDKNYYNELIKNEVAASSLSLKESGDFNKNKINRTYGVSSFVIAPIMPKEGNKGFLCIGRESTEMATTEGDEEIITILTNQIGQAIENARLFEKTWRTQQDLEKKVEERTHQLTTALEEVRIINKRKSEFISSVSHELRTPLTSVKGYAAILTAEKLGKLPPAVKERLEKINRHSDELVKMVNDLLDIARIEAGKTVMKMELLDIANIIANIVDLIMIQCKNKNIELATDIEKDIPLIYLDRNQIERVFINLLGNAVKFTPEAGKITVRAQIKNEFLEIKISDTGIGMPPEALN